MRPRPVIGKATVPDAVRRLQEAFDYPDREALSQLVPILPSLGVGAGGGVPDIVVGPSDTHDTSKAQVLLTGTDDQILLQSILETAKADNLWVHMLSGTVNVTAVMDVGSGLFRLSGSGVGLTTLLAGTWSGGSRVFRGDEGSGIFYANDFTIDGNGNVDSGYVALDAEGGTCRWDRVEVKNCTSFGIHYDRAATSTGWLNECFIHDNTDDGIIFGREDSAQITNCLIHNNGSRGIRAGGTNQVSMRIIGNAIFDNASHGIESSGAIQDANDCIIIGNIIRDNGGTSIALDGDGHVIVGNILTGNGTDGPSAVGVIMGNNIGGVGSSPTLGDGTELTIAGGVITITQGFHAVDTQADAATDELDTINGGVTGQLLVLKSADDARDPTVKDAVDNLQLAGDFTLSDTDDTITLIYDGTNWLEVSRSDNA